MRRRPYTLRARPSGDDDDERVANSRNLYPRTGSDRPTAAPSQPTEAAAARADAARGPHPSARRQADCSGGGGGGHRRGSSSAAVDNNDNKGNCDTDVDAAATAAVAALTVAARLAGSSGGANLIGKGPSGCQRRRRSDECACHRCQRP